MSIQTIIGLSVLVSWIGIIVFQYSVIKHQLLVLIVGRSLVGVMYSQYPFLCETVSRLPNPQTAQAIMMSIGLAGYFMGPILLMWISYFVATQIFFVVMAGVAIAMFFSRLDRIENVSITNNVNINPQISYNQQSLLYLFFLQMVWNITASSLEYIISPIVYRSTTFLFHSSKSVEIGWVVSIFFAVLIVTSMGIALRTRDPIPVSTILYWNQCLIVFCMYSTIILAFSLWVADWSSIKCILVLYGLIWIHAIAVAGFMWSSVQLGANLSFLGNSKMDPTNTISNIPTNTIISWLGITASLFYIVGPLLNTLFFIQPGFPFALQFVLWCTIYGISRIDANHK